MSNIILSIDSSINCSSITLYKKKCIYSITEKCINQHTIKILPMIHKILLQTKTMFQDLNYVAFAKGPGNFTGIRIAAGIAQSLGISLNIPTIGISTLLIMAEQAWRKYKRKNIIVAIHAKKTEVYWAEYKRNKESIWIGENTESVLKTKFIQDKINSLKGHWTLVGNIWNQIDYNNVINFQKTEILFPNAQDIIPFILLKIKNKKSFYCLQNKINYLCNNF